MKRLKLLIGMLLTAAIALSVGMSTLSAFADTQAIEDAPAISLEEDFDGTSVLVTMTEEISEVNKVYDKSFFGDIEISSIEDLSTITGNIAEKEYFDESKFKQILQLHLPIDSEENVLEVVDKLEDIDGVLNASPNYYTRIAEIPNDNYFSDLWGMERENGINAVDAWDITTGNSEIKVGVIDTGIANHPDLNANLAEGWDFVNNNNITNDDPTGHGTHVAGTIGAVGNNQIGVVGVNWDVTLVPLQVVDWYPNEEINWQLNTSAVVAAINWAKNNNIPVLNYSAGGTIPRENVKAALDSYTGLFVCSAGNGIRDDTLGYNVGVNTDITAHYPSEYSDETNASYSNISDRIISVGSINNGDSKSTFSNYGERTVSIYAPGGSIYSTVPTNLEPSGYETKSGTSMAAPHVAGVAALLLSADPTLTASELKTIILNSADTISITVPAGSSTSTQQVKKLNALNALSQDRFIISDIGENEIQINGFNTASSTNVLSIPSVINGRRVTSIAPSAFANKTSLTEAYIPDTVANIGAGAFENCSNLTTVTGLKGVVTIASNAFKNCSALTSITLPASLTSIGNHAFSGVSNLVGVTITNSSSSQLTTIGAGAFADCTSLTRFGTATYFYLTLPSSVTSIGSDAFKGTTFRYISIGANVTDISETAFSDIDTLISFTVSSANTKYRTANGVLYNSDGWLMQYPAAKTGTSFSIPETVNGTAIKYISPYAFEGNNNLTTVSLPYIITIGEGAFKNCSNLTTLTGDGNIEFIGASAFDGTPVASRTDKVITFGKVLYRYNGTDTILNETDFPSAVNRISAYAFSNNADLQTINLPVTVLHIDDNAFYNCSNLEGIRYLNGILPSVGINAFEGLASDFKFYCRKSLIDGVTSSSDWALYSSVMSPVKTAAYFEDINEYATFYYGETVEIPSTPVSGYYNKGWLRVNAETDETYGGYLTPSVWTETAATATFRADLLVLESYTLYFYNGDAEIGAFNISIGDTYEITQQGYRLNGGAIINFANHAEMTNCAYNEYYGPAVVNGETIATFDGWMLNGSVLGSGQWMEYYDDNALYVYANWTPKEFTVTYNNGYGDTSPDTFNYCDGLTLPEPTRSGYKFKGWKNNSTGAIMVSPVRVAGNLTLTAQWVRVYNIYYRNLTFLGKTASVLWNYEIGNYAPTEYEYGVGLNLSNIVAFWQPDGPYSPQLHFLGWYTSTTFLTKRTNISVTNTGNVYLYAKWRYDQGNAGRIGTYTITDADRFTQSYDQISVALSSYNDLVNIGMEYLAITLKINMWEVNDGYQYIFIYDGSGSGATLLWEQQITFGGNGKDSTPGVEEFQIYIPLDKLKNVQFLYIRYGASGAFSDTWQNDRIYLELMYVVKQDDIYSPEFYWAYQDPFD